MPTKNLSSPYARGTTNQGSFTFGGGAELVFTDSENASGEEYPFGYVIDTRGGNDIIYGSDIGGPGDGNGDDLTGGDGDDVIFGGGGDDTIRGGNIDDSDSSKGRNPPPTNLLVGDGVRQGDGSYVASITILAGENVAGGWDTITGGDGATNNIYGDYSDVTLTGDGTSGMGAVYVGGKDTLIGGHNDEALLAGDLNLLQNNIFGDADIVLMRENTAFTGGIDTITGGRNADNSLYGDANIVTFSGIATDAIFTGGNDVITGGDAFGTDLPINDIFGDASSVRFSDAAGESFTGGNDTIFGGDLLGPAPSAFIFTNVIYGDVFTITGNGSFQGGDDTIHSGTYANDRMYGDWGSDGSGTAMGGEDTFVFAINNGDDTIKDLRITDTNGDGGDGVGDKIDLSAFNFDGRTFGVTETYATIAALLEDLIVEIDGTAVIDFSQDDDGLSGSGTITVVDWTAAELEALIGTDAFIL